MSARPSLRKSFSKQSDASPAVAPYVEHEIAEELVFSNIRSPTHPLEDLSSRDLEILRLLAQGRGLGQIADALGISYKTAANNCSQIKAKLRVATTADLIRIAIQHGLADLDASRPSVR